MAAVLAVLLAALLAAAAGGRPALAARPKVEEAAAQLSRQMRARGTDLGEIHLALGALYARAGVTPRVLRHLRIARAKGVATSRIDLVLGTFFRRQGRFDAALSTFVRVLVHNPEQPYALVQLWKTLYECQLQQVTVKNDLSSIRERLGRYGLHLPAELVLDQGAAVRSKKLTAAGYNALLGGKVQFAVELFESAIDALPSNARAHRGLGLALTRREDFRRATGAYLLYLELSPNAPDAAEIDEAIVGYWRQRLREAHQ